MKKTFKHTGFGFGILYAVAVILALTGRISIAVLDSMDGITYDYISVSAGPKLTQLLSIFTGSQLYICMTAMGLACALFAAANVLSGIQYAKHGEKINCVWASLFWGVLTTVAALICAGLIGSGMFSAVQRAALKAKSSGGAGTLITAILFVLTIATLFASSVQVIYACIVKGKTERGIGIRLIIAALFWGLLTSVLAVLTFKVFNTVNPETTACLGLLITDIAVNLIIAFSAHFIAKKAA